MDLSKFDLSAVPGVKMEVRTPTGEPMMKSDGITPVTITLLSADSDPMIKARNLSLNMSVKRSGKPTAEAVQADGYRLMAKATTAWDGIGIGEDETPFTFENAVRLYTEYPFIREQVDAFITERSNFLTT